MKLSVLIISRNCENVIKGTLDNVRKLGSEIVIVDSGSEDKTLTIARKFTNKIFIHKFRNDFSELRNFAVSKAKGEWIFFIDSDERLSSNTLKEIPKLIINSNVEGFWFRRKNFVTKDKYLRYGLFYPDYQLRLFRRRKEYTYSGRVHEQLNIPEERTKKTVIDILHFAQHPKYNSFKSIINMTPYINLSISMYVESSRSSISLLLNGINSFLSLFFGGYIRGKGFLDGWVGFRAHLIFASSISIAYLLAFIKRSKNAHIL